RVIGLGIDPARQAQLSPIVLADGESGRFIASGQAGNNEIILEEKLAAALGGAVVGDVLDVPRFGEPIRLRVVGIARQPALSVIFDQLQAYVNIDTIGRLSDKPGRIGELDILIDPTLDPIAWSEQTQKRLKDAAQPGDPALLVQASAKVTSGLDKNIRGNQIGFILASTLAFVAAAFIITTGLTTNVTERIRELAVLRCIGGTRQQLARSQRARGATIGAMGAVLGV
ncbi:MAG: ABC transporter permease, partial [Planctomyces sp.]